ncbi:MAG: UbiA prenyltransferase [Candidatus Syntrophoarchaeum caldarius]|uniref:UbiA prenyltransferase n=1 Tax=Candidatus Syntropharchaeum caldarium TaxID=1838285 RepID=A0A1F2PBE7_9EURY|nr:MAG: UbiA prenyltransferase [Candidatus Syntrophoarchaeum caldarius]
MQFKAIWKLTRAEHGIMYAAAVIVGAILAGGGLADASILFTGTLTAILLEAGTFALNDYYDFEVDRKNNRLDRPLVTGKITPREAFLIGWLLTALGLIVALFLTVPCIILAYLAAIFGILYDIKLKETGIGGNIYISITMAVPFIFGGFLIKSELDPILLILASIAFLIGFGREVMKGIVDVEGDAIRDVKTIARKWGVIRAKQVSILLYFLGISISPLPFLLKIDPVYHMNLAYLIPLLITDLLLLYLCIRLLTADKETVNQLRSLSLIALLFGLIAFLTGAMIRIP